MTRSAIHASGLRKSYGDHVVLDGVDLDVAEGTVYALQDSATMLRRNLRAWRPCAGC